MAVPSFSAVDRFLRAVHRRHVVLRAAERTGLGTLGGSAVALLLLPLLLWQGRPALEPCAAAVIVAMFVGLLWGVLRRPAMLEAALEADRQLGLQDLLSSAYVVRRDANDPWAGTLLAVADDRCRRLAPSSVILNRLGARAWGGIGLATTLALVLALFTGVPTRSSAADGPAGGVDTRSTTPAAPDKPLLFVPNATPRAAVTGRDNDGGAKAGGDVTSESHLPDTNPAAGTTDRGANPSASPSAAGPNGAGTGSARTKPPELSGRTQDPLPTGADPASKAGTPTSPGTTLAKGGTGRSTGGEPGSPAGPSGAAGAGSATGPGTPPWKTDRWPADVERARHAVDRGEIPPAYRDLVRKYFERQ